NERGQREQGRLSPWRSEISVEAELEPPAGWWIEPGHEALAATRRGHGFDVLDAAPGAAPDAAPDAAPGDAPGVQLDARAPPPVAPLLAYPRCIPSGDADAVRAPLRPYEGPLPAGAAWVP